MAVVGLRTEKWANVVVVNYDFNRTCIAATLYSYGEDIQNLSVSATYRF